MTKKETAKLDKYWRVAIKDRDKFCQVCGNTNSLNAHHIVGRRNRMLRWDLLNGVLLCAGCHTFKTKSAHQDPIWFSDWFSNKYPDRKEYIDSNREEIYKSDYSEALNKILRGIE